MNFRLKIAAWFTLSVFLIVAVLIFTAHAHLDGELRHDRKDPSHPAYAQWVIHGSYTNAEVEDILGELLHIWLLVGIPLVVVSAGVGYFLAIRSIRPIRQINRELARLNFHSLDRGVHVPEKDPELNSLAQHINDLLTRLGRSYHEMSEFSAQVAHELRNPLTLLRMRLESAAPQLPAEFSEEMQEGLRHLSKLVERSLLAAKADGGKLETQAANVNLDALLDDLRDGYTLLSAERSIVLDWQVAPALVCVSDPDLLRQILHNLLGNAVRYGQHKICLKAWASESKKRIIVQIANLTGDSQPTSSGTGMGLRLVRALAHALVETRFNNRHTPRFFLTRLSLPAATASQSLT
ncbi:MAG: HAMP domain-containing sensor histidine kinase [Chthoniobacterales bacterium]